MSATQTSFYVTGGTLQSNAASYVRRRADEDLYEGLSRGDICYVLTSRQMGKSSLMVRTATRLRAEGVTVAVIDLTAVGQNLTAEQWYDGLLNRVGRQLDLEDELEEFWEEHGRVGPLQRWMLAVREVVLRHRRGRVVFFVDEIDVVRTLPFSTDEFFAGLREFYNRRTEEPELERLTFCLLGVAAPSDLIRDTRMTPFNVGRRIELTDFTEEEAAPLAEGMNRPGAAGRELLKRILHWTGGHPYLTQRLCQSVAADEDAAGAGGVDRLCEELFLSARARERDDNLLFVRERILRSEVDRASLLDLYLKARSHKAVRDDESDPLVSVLRLSGITRAVEGYLHVRNRIYYRVFDREWVVSNMPDAEVRRQRAAYRRGLLRAASVAAVVLLLLGGLTAWAVGQKRAADQQRARAEAEKRRAEQALAMANEERERALGLMKRAEQGEAEADSQRKEAEQQRAAAEAQRKEAVSQQERAEEQRAEAERQRRQAVESSRAREVAQQQREDAERRKAEAEAEGIYTKRLLYAVHMNQAQAAWDEANVGRLQKILERYAPPRPGEQLADEGGAVRGFEWDYLHRLAEADIERERARLPQPGNNYLTAFSRDGRRAVIATTGEQPSSRASAVKVWDVAGRKELASLRFGDNRLPVSLAVSPDGELIASGAYGGVSLWRASTGERLKTAGDEPEQTERVAYRRGLVSDEGIIALAFSPDARVLAAGERQTNFTTDGARVRGTLTLREVSTLKVIATAREVEGGLTSLAFSNDGRTLVTGRGDGKLLFWRVPPGAAAGDVPFAPAATLEGHEQAVTSVAFSANGKAFATGSADGQVKFWNFDSRRRAGFTLTGHEGAITSLAFSRDGRLLATGGADRTVKLWPVSVQAAMSGDAGEDSSDEVRELGARRDAASTWRIEVASLATGGAGDGDGEPAPPFDPRELFASAFRPAYGIGFSTSSDALVTFKGHDGPVMSVAFSGDGKRVTSFGGDNALRSWEVNSEPEWTRVGRFTSQVYCVAYSPDGKLLAAGSSDRELLEEGKNVRVWDTATGELRFAFKTRLVNFVAFSPDGRRLAAAGAAGVLTLLDTATGRELWSTGPPVDSSGEKLLRPDFYAVAFSPDGRYMAAGDQAGRVTVWDAATLRQMITPPQTQRGSVEAVTFSPDSKLLAAAGHDGLVRLWETGTWREAGRLVATRGAQALPGESGGDPQEFGAFAVKAAAFSPDGRFLVTGGMDRVARLWDLSDRARAPLLLEGHAGAITFVSFSPDGRRLATASADDTVRLWDTASGQEVAVLRGHKSDVWAAVFSPGGGETIATGAADGDVRLWRSRPRSR